MKTNKIELSRRAIDMHDEIRDENIYNGLKCGIADLFGYALSDITQYKLSSNELHAFETLSFLNELIFELSIEPKE